MASVAELGGFAAALGDAIEAARQATEHLLGLAGTDQRSVLAASSPYLRLLGTTVCAGLLAKGALAASGHDDDFHRGKVIAARYFGEQILPVAMRAAARRSKPGQQTSTRIPSCQRSVGRSAD